MTASVAAVAVRWLSDEPFPGMVEVHLTDGSGKTWTFIDKSAMFDPDDVLRATSDYPVDLKLACTVLSRTTEGVIVSTAEPWGLETIDGKWEFLMLPSQVEES